MQTKFNNIPILVTRGSFIFPGVDIKLEVGRKKSVAAIKESQLHHHSKIIVLSQKDAKQEAPTFKDIYMFGTLCSLEIDKAYPEDIFSVVFKGLERIKVSDIKDDEFYHGKADVVNDKSMLAKNEKQLIATIVNNLQFIFDVHGTIPKEVINQITDGMKPSEIIDKMAQFLPYLTIEKRQEILEEIDVNKRLQLLMADVGGQKQAGVIENDITNIIKDRIDDQQREFYLREKLRVIKEQLGEIDGKSNEMKHYLERLENEPFPEHVKERVREEIGRYEDMPPSSSESYIIRNYIETVMGLPWHQEIQEKNDLIFAKKTLDKYHYGLQKVKERIIEYLAVKQMAKTLSGQIICLVGPPGVGKTSLAKAIAEATGRNFVKVALGGVKDESEVRGHRRTYIGAMPGKILKSMKQAGVVNPLFLLDEIDKMSSDMRGDPASAMLEVLDPEQNANFMDHYVDINYDLSKVMFLATANDLRDIPEALRDRMEIIELTSYTELEKIEISKKYLIPRVLKATGLNAKLLKFKPSAIENIIKHYTREAGVRQLERIYHKFARKFIVKYLDKEITSDTISESNVTQYLGKPIFDFSKKEKQAQVGVVNGLAYTQYGGDILPIEVNYYKGKGNLFLTGKLGDVMKESASIALSYIKANSELLKVDPTIFPNIDIHLHVPEGAVPKDGPSAGITITTAIISALTGRPVSKDLGMTGEITLRGIVLGIGGLKEKLISANRSGLKVIIIPEYNLKDLDEVPKEVLDKLKIIPVSHYNQVYNYLHANKVEQQIISKSFPSVSKSDDSGESL